MPSDDEELGSLRLSPELQRKVVEGRRQVERGEGLKSLDAL